MLRNAYFDWYLEATKLKKAARTLSLLLLLPHIFFYLNCLVQMLYLFLFQLICLLLLFFPNKGRKKKSEVIITPFKEEPITGRDEPSLAFTTHPGPKQNFRALAKEFPIQVRIH